MSMHGMLTVTYSCLGQLALMLRIGQTCHVSLCTSQAMLCICVRSSFFMYVYAPHTIRIVILPPTVPYSDGGLRNAYARRPVGASHCLQVICKGIHIYQTYTRFSVPCMQCKSLADDSFCIDGQFLR